MSKRIPLHIIVMTDFLCDDTCPFLKRHYSTSEEATCMLFHATLNECHDGYVYLRCDQCQNLQSD
jgi:hypothetical protein